MLLPKGLRKNLKKKNSNLGKAADERELLGDAYRVVLVDPNIWKSGSTPNAETVLADTEKYSSKIPRNYSAGMEWRGYTLVSPDAFMDRLEAASQSKDPCEVINRVSIDDAGSVGRIIGNAISGEHKALVLERLQTLALALEADEDIAVDLQALTNIKLKAFYRKLVNPEKEPEDWEEIEETAKPFRTNDDYMDRAKARLWKPAPRKVAASVPSRAQPAAPAPAREGFDHSLVWDVVIHGRPTDHQAYLNCNSMLKDLFRDSQHLMMMFQTGTSSMKQAAGYMSGGSSISMLTSTAAQEMTRRGLDTDPRTYQIFLAEFPDKAAMIINTAARNGYSLESIYPRPAAPAPAPSRGGGNTYNTTIIGGSASVGALGNNSKGVINN